MSVSRTSGPLFVGGQSLMPQDKPDLHLGGTLLHRPPLMSCRGRGTPDQFQALCMFELVLMADYVATTPNATTRSPYKESMRAAPAVVFDEAGAMCVADALMVWGPTMRPCAMGGDEKQLPPAVMDRENNRFYEQGGVSVLQHWQQTSSASIESEPSPNRPSAT